MLGSRLQVRGYPAHTSRVSADRVRFSLGPRLLFGYTRKFSSGKCLWNWPCHAFNFCLCHDPSDLHTLKRFYYRAVPSMPNQLFGDIDKTLLLSLYCDKHLFSRRGLTELECGGGSATLPNGPCQAREGV